MKKRLLLTLALLLAALLVSGCSLDALLQSAQKNSGEIVVSDEPVEGLATEAYESDYAMPMATGMPLTAGAPNMSYAPADWNTEEYAAIRENGFQSVITSPLSTFSADVDTASYCNLRRMLNEGWTPEEIPAGAVRAEEMLNYFRYDYAAPEGDDRFSVTAELAPCPWNPEAVLLRLGIRAAEAGERAEEGSNLVFLVDVSGSMDDENKLGLVKRALGMLTDELTDKDTVSIVTYSDGEEIVIEGANPQADKARLLTAIESLEAGGYTDGQRGLEQAYEVAQRYFRPHGNNRVIMCSDGDLNVGITSESDLHDYVSEKRETGVYLSVLGFGAGNYKDTKMETLADDGNGSYYYIDSILEARKVLVEELTQTLYAVADDVKFQIEFNPAMVAAYRQIGYENRALDDADFADDKKDAGEVGSGACVTVLYELLPGDADAPESGLKYQTSGLSEAAASGEWLTVSIRYKEPGGVESKLQTHAVGGDAYSDTPSGDFRFTAAVAEFAMLLNDSEYKGDASYDAIMELLKDAPLNDDYREEFFSLVKIAERAEALDQ